MLKLETKFGPFRLRNPLILASGTASRNGETCKKMAEAGVGAIITKTIEEYVSPVPRPCIARYDGGLLNCEGWSDLSPEEWARTEIYKAKHPGVPLIANIYGENKDRNQFNAIIESLEVAGIDGFEIAVGEYSPDPSDPYLPWALNATSLPIIAKIPHSFESKYLETARFAADQDIIGLSTMDSLGPALMINVKSGRPYFGSKAGDCRISGPAIRPLAIRKVADLAQNFDLPILGIGGISGVNDVIEMIMAGATTVGMATKPITATSSFYPRLLSKMDLILNDLGYSTLDEARGIALQYFDQAPNYTSLFPKINISSCTGCKKCEQSCPYGAITIKSKKVTINQDLCYGCGLCVSVCPVDTLSIPYPL